MSNSSYGTILAAISLDGKYLTQEFSPALLCQRLLNLKEEDSREILTDLDWDAPDKAAFRLKKINPSSLEKIFSLNHPFFLLGSPTANKLALEAKAVDRIALLWTPSLYPERKKFLIEASFPAHQRIKFKLESWKVFPEGCACHYKVAANEKR